MKYVCQKCNKEWEDIHDAQDHADKHPKHDVWIVLADED